MKPVYKRIASKKAVYANAEAPPLANNLPEPETSNEPYNTSSDELDTNKENSPMIIDEPVGQEEAPNSQLLVDCVDKIELEEVEGEEAELLVMVQDPPAQVEFSDQNDNVEEEMIMPLKVNVLIYRWFLACNLISPFHLTSLCC